MHKELQTREETGRYIFLTVAISTILQLTVFNDLSENIVASLIIKARDAACMYF